MSHPEMTLSRWYLVLKAPIKPKLSLKLAHIQKEKSQLHLLMKEVMILNHHDSITAYFATYNPGHIDI